MGKALTPEDFLERSRKVWGDRWDYSRTEFKGVKAKTNITCREHGEFTQVAHTHLLGKVGCPECSGRGRGSPTFIERSKAVWGESKWGYEKVDYVNNSTPVKLRCLDHGYYDQHPKSHLRGANGCPECGLTTPLTQETFERRVVKLWGDRWDYSKAQYVNNSTPVLLRCKEHGEFSQIPMTLFVGQVGCGKCNGKKTETEDYLKRAREFWGDRWDYTKTQYTKSDDKVTITCRTHGDFQQVILDHLYGRVGCPSCQAVPRSSRGEDEIAQSIEGLGFQVQRRKRDLLGSSRLEVDIYVPEKKLAIEFNGCYYHSDLFRVTSYHKDKRDLANLAGIRLLQVWEDDYRRNPSVVQEHIRQVLGVSSLPKISARSTEVRTLSAAEAKEFLERYHIQGFHPSSVYLGLEQGHDVIAVASFKKQGADYVLTRYATSANVRGGHSKLVSYFERNYRYEQLVTFADLTFSEGDLYRATGWVEDKALPPDYQYLVGGIREHKFNYRKNRFKKDPVLKYSEGLSERELARLNGMLRVYDAGKVRFVKPRVSDTD